MFPAAALAVSAVRRRLHHGEDSAHALGQMYGHLVALIMPFIGPEDSLLVSPGLRSENTENNIARTRSLTSPDASGQDRAYGDTRGMFTACKDTALKLLRGWHQSADAMAFEKRLEVGTFAHLKQQPSWPYLPFDVLNGIADLGASLMSMTHFPSYAIKLDAREIPPGNTRFFQLDDLIREAA